MQLKLSALLVCLTSVAAWADDRAEVSTTLFLENRDSGDKGGLRVFHPQADFGIDL